MTDKEKIHQILSSLWKNDDSVGKTYYNQALQDVQTAIDLQKEPVSNDFEMALAEMVDKAQRCVVEPWVIASQWKDCLIELAKSEEPVSEQNLSNVERTVKEWKEPVSEDLEKAAREHSNNLDNIRGSIDETVRNAYKAGAKWQEEQMMAKAIDATCFRIQGAALFTFRLPAGSYLVGSKVKVIVIKED